MSGWLRNAREGPSSPRPQESGCRVLVAEGNPLNRSVALRLLGRAGLRAVAVSNGRQAVEAATVGQYDLILLDIQMPEMDGFQAAAEIRRCLGPVQHPPIIAMTTRQWPPDRHLAAGIDDYLPKPLRLEELSGILRCWTGPDRRKPAFAGQ